MSKAACPRCGAPALQPGASKCPSCRRWVGPRPPWPLDLRAIAGASAALLACGALLGAAAARRVSVAPAPAQARGVPPAGSPSGAGSGAASGAPAPASAGGQVGAPRPSAAPAPPPAGKVQWGAPRSLKLSGNPVDVALAYDGATAYVLGQDGMLRAVAVDSGREERRLVLPGRGTALRLLDGGYLGVLGLSGALPIVDLATWTVAKVDAGAGVVDVVALDEGRAIVVASAEERRATRFRVKRGQARGGPGPATWQPDGEIPLAHAALGLSLFTARAEAPAPAVGAVPVDSELVAVLARPERPGVPGSIHLLDPRMDPFGASRLTFEIALDAGAAVAPGLGELSIVDRGATQVLRVRPGEPLEIVPVAAPAGAPPAAQARASGAVLGAYLLLRKYLVVVDMSGQALVVSAADGTVVASLPLGAAPSAAAATPDGRGLLIALGGGAGGGGAQTALVTGDPPAIEARVATGAGSRAVSVARSGGRAAVASYLTRSIAILDLR